MKIKEGFILRKVGGSNVIVPTGNETNEFNGMITTNDTGAFIFEKLQSGMNSDEIVKTITEEFEIDSETATKDVEKFIEKMKDTNIFE